MTATRSDRVRQFAVTVSGITCVVGTLVGIGVLGTRVEDSAGGSLSADATLLAPASTAFTIWSAIYAGLAAFTVWQWLPRAATSRRIRSVGWLAAASMLLNATWLLVVQQGWLWASVGVIVALVAILAVLVKRLSAEPAGSAAEKVVVDGTFGLYLGWVCVATAANIAATIAAEGIEPVRAVTEGIAALVLLLVGAVGMMLAVVLGGRIAVASAIVSGARLDRGRAHHGQPGLHGHGDHRRSRRRPHRRRHCRRPVAGQAIAGRWRGLLSGFTVLGPTPRGLTLCVGVQAGA